MRDVLFGQYGTAPVAHVRELKMENARLRRSSELLLSFKYNHGANRPFPVGFTCKTSLISITLSPLFYGCSEQTEIAALGNMDALSQQSDAK